jgi:DNA-binding response OmpR family regulator
MITLIVTADDALYGRLASRCAEAATFRRATDVLEAHAKALDQPIDSVIVDISLHAADTLVETLRSRPATAHIPVYVVGSGERLPFALRRLCTDILEADGQ